LSRRIQALTAPQAARLEKVFRKLQGGGVAQALAIARSVSAEAPGAPDALHALALCCSASGDRTGAQEAFARALELTPDHPLMLGNYAKFLQKDGRAEEALGALERAARAAPNSAPTWTELGIAALKLGQTARAVAALDRALVLRPDMTRAWHALGNARRAAGDLEGAEAAFRRLVTLAPDNGPAWVNLGVVLRLLGRPAEALPCLAQARKAGYSGPELEDAEAGAMVDIGQFEAAIGKARALVGAFPQYAPGQIMLVHLLWEHGAAIAPGEDPLGMIRPAVQDQPDNRQLQLAYIGLLLEIRRPEEALQRARVLRERTADPLLLAQEANALEMLDRPAQAAALFEQAHRMLGSSAPWFLNAYARHLLKAGKWDAAASRATEATETDPDNQEAWAYLGTAWRLMGDAREHWLCDYERLIALVEVEPPPGFGGAPEFLAALEATLDPLHKARREPIRQSLRGGSQTPGRLFGRPDPVIDASRAALLQAIERRVAVLPTDPGHPFLRRKARSVRFSGSWSVKLWSSGSHVNHIHPQGWMSSAYYVSLPPSVRDTTDDNDTAGFIQFGQPPVELGLDLPPRRVIRPRVGCLALFPSYMWHGTVPFEDDAPRITVAFDMTPTD
jgi:tetratricopeptide (TPR) repeat protein